MNRFVRYRISTWQQNWGEHRKWFFVIEKFILVTFKRSKRVGWRGMGFVNVKADQEDKGYDTRVEALAAAREARKQLS